MESQRVGHSWATNTFSFNVSKSTNVKRLQGIKNSHSSAKAYIHVDNPKSRKSESSFNLSFKQVVKYTVHFRKLSNIKSVDELHFSETFTHLVCKIFSHQNLLNTCYAQQLVSRPWMEESDISGGEMDHHCK